jgi:hypothetical protein
MGQLGLRTCTRQQEKLALPESGDAGGVRGAGAHARVYAELEAQAVRLAVLMLRLRSVLALSSELAWSKSA